MPKFYNENGTFNKIGDPLFELFNIHGFDTSLIKIIITGQKYVAVMLNSGNIGLAANLDDHKNINIKEIEAVNFDSMLFRTVYTAYVNAMINYSVSDITELDFFSCIDFDTYNTIVMIGYSEPLLYKFSQINKLPHVFDLDKKNHLIKNQSELAGCLRHSDCLVITATTLINNTFKEIVLQTPKTCDIFLIGPSSPIDTTLFLNYNVTAIFGMLFKNNDFELLEIIKNDGGTDKFKKIGKKAAFLKS